MDHQLAVARNVAGDDRHAGGHRFHHGVRLAFVAAAVPKHVEMRHDSPHVVALAEEANVIEVAGQAGEPLERRALGPVADHQQPQVVVQHAQQVGRPDEVLHALSRARVGRRRRSAGRRPGSRVPASSSPRETSLARAGSTPLGITMNFLGRQSVLGAIVANGRRC